MNGLSEETGGAWQQAGMEDSGYYSHRSSEFKFSSATGSTGRIPAPDDIFKLTFSDLNSPRYRYFRYGFTDEEDFEEFKQDLKNFRRLKREAREEFVDESPSPRNSRDSRSGLLENLKRLSRSLERPRSGRGTDPFMEFFSGDEHFQEFERVFDTINNHRFSREMDYRRPGSWREGSTEKDPFDDSDDLGALHIDETFSDFFDHDEDFMEFERELEKIKSNRRSRLLENLNRRSSCDIFSDVKAFCDRSLSRSRQNLSNTSPKVERRTSARDSADPELWNSAEEWEFVMNKLKRNSRLFCDPPKASRADDTVPNTPTAGHSDQCPCLRDCQYTCHLNCVPSVTLDCTTVSPGSGGGPVATPTDLPSPSASAETSLTDRRTVVSHRSPQQQQQQQQQQQSSTSTPSRQLSQPCINVPHVQSVGASHQRTSPAQNVLLSSGVTDPLTGASVLQTSTSAPLLSSSSSSSTASSSQCVERDLNQNAKTCAQGDAAPECRLLGDDLLVCDVPNEKDETDSGYRSGTIPDEKLPKAPSQATLNRRELQRKIQTFNHFVPKATLEMLEDGLSFQGFIKVTLNLIRPITMELGARPPSIYELLTREHIVEQSTQHIAFYMPRDTVKSIHINSKTTTKEVITNLLKKFHILDNPRKFAMYEQEFNEKNKLVKLRRLTDKDFPLTALLSWDPEKIKFYRLVLQENETGEIVWDAFSLPELGNFLQVLDKEEQEAKAQLQYKYRIMRRIILQRLKELRKERAAQAVSVA
nr:hypothetical protein BaRGS_006077 [Batillaria attramentaria]